MGHCGFNSEENTVPIFTDFIVSWGGDDSVSKQKIYQQIIPKNGTPTQPGTPNPDLMSEAASKLGSEVCVGVWSCV